MYVYKEEEMGPQEPAPQETPGEGLPRAGPGPWRQQKRSLMFCCDSLSWRRSAVLEVEGRKLDTWGKAKTRIPLGLYKLLLFS